MAVARVWDADNAEWIEIGGAGRPGSPSYALDPNLKPPTTPHASDVEFLHRANGTTPATAGLTWLNQGTVTASVQGGTLVMFVPSTKTTGGGLMVPVPAGDWNMAARLRVWPTQNYHGFGLLAVNDTTLGTFLNWREAMRILSDPNGLSWINLNSSWAYGGTIRATRTYGVLTGPAYLRFAWNNTTSVLTGQVSVNPAAGWATIGTATYVGQPVKFVGIFFDGSGGPTDGTAGQCDFLRFNWTPDYDPTL